jgi:Flp pilus assembly protein TadD/DNA-binding response OmpR family regulator
MASPSQPAPAPKAQPKTGTSGLHVAALRPLPSPVALAPAKPSVAKPTPRLQAVAPPRGPAMPAPDDSTPPDAGLEPTVLLVGRGERFAPALEAALSRHHVLVESTTLDAVVDAVVTVAPDLVLVVGDAARDAGNLVLEKLAVLPKNFVVPIVILGDDTALDSKLRAFRHGATAIIPRTASVDATATKVAEMAREMPGQDAETVGVLGEATLEEFVATLEKQLRSGLEGVASDAGPTADMRLVLGQGRPLAEFVDNFVRRVRRHVLRAEPLRYELGEKGGADTLGLRNSISPARSNELSKLRVVLADDDTPRADAVAQELRSRGTTVVVTDLDPSDGRFQKLRHVDPTILIIGEQHVHGDGHSLLRRMRRDSRLRWASMMIVRWDDVFSEQAGAPAIERLESTLAGLAEPERALRDRIELKMPFETRLEVMGPARCLRTLADGGHPLRVTLENARVEVVVDLSDGLVVGAQGRALDGSGAVFEGVHALSALLVVGSGRVRVEPADQPASANIMSPVDVTLTMADAETPPIAPSIPAAGTVSIPPFQAPEGEVRLPSLRPAPIVSVNAAAGSEARGAPPPVAAPPVAAPPHPMPARMMMTPPQPFAVIPPAPAVPRTSEGTLAAYPVAAAQHVAAQAAPAAAAPTGVGSSGGVGGKLRAAWAAVAPHLGSARRWLEAEEARVHHRRLAPRTALLLLGLGVFQGGAIVAIYAAVRGVSHDAPATAAVAAAAPPVETAPAVTPAKALAPAAQPAPVSAPASAGTAAVPASGKGPDGSGRKAPDCKALFGSDPPPEGFYPGAAWQEVKAGRSSIVRGDLGAAQASFCRAVRWDKTNGEVAMQLAQVLLLHRDGAQALEWAQKAATLDPSSLRAKETLGDALARTGEDDQARAAWLAAARIDPSDQRGVRGLVMREVRAADRALKGHELVVAEKYFRRAALLEPRSWSAMVGLSYVLLELGEVKPAVVWAERAVAAAPRNSSVRLALGDALSRAGETARATEAWREATLLDPNNREARKRLRRGG